eukprot:COSAG05_NODE_999_length_6247_cov_26.499024_4_plen_106_part_00
MDYRSMPTCCRIKLRRGQTCFFTGTAIHRGFKESVGAPARLSLSWGLQSLDAPHEPGARWEPESGDEVGAWLDPPMRTMWERWREVVARPFPESIGLSHQKPARL